MLRRYGQFKQITVALLAGIVLLLSKTPAEAIQFGFSCITDNLAGDCATGEAQLFVDVTDPGGNQALFFFTNVGSSSASITAIYFDDGTLLGIASVDNSSSGVSFTENVINTVNPPKLPGGKSVSPPFKAISAFSSDSDGPTAPNGVDPDEYLGITFDLQFGGTFADVLTELDSGDLRIGIKVQAFGSGSESFVNNPTPVPEPATIILLGYCLAGLGLMGKRKGVYGGRGEAWLEFSV